MASLAALQRTIALVRGCTHGTPGFAGTRHLVLGPSFQQRAGARQLLQVPADGLEPPTAVFRHTAMQHDGDAASGHATQIPKAGGMPLATFVGTTPLGGLAPVAGQTHVLNGCSRSFSTAASRRNTNSFFVRNHVGLVAVPHQMAYVIERFGRFHRVLPSGLHLLIPFVDRVAYAHSLKEETLPIPNQSAITRDNVTLQIDGVLYVRIQDAYKASYGVENPIFAVTQLAQTTMRSELGKLTLDNTFLERDTLNKAIVEAINSAAGPWGLTCLRYEIRDILLPANIRTAMERQAEAERLKRADVLRSEGEKACLVNLALGQKEATILNAEGQAEAVKQRAAAAAESIRKIAETTSIPGGMHALSLQLAENYVSAFGRLAEGSNTLIVPADAANTAQMLGQALGIFKAVDASMSRTPPSSLPPVKPEVTRA